LLEPTDAGLQGLLHPAAADRAFAFVRKVIDHTPSLVFVKDLEGNFLLVNQALADLFGVSVEEVEGQPYRGGSPSVDADERRMVESGEPLSVEEKFILPSGEPRWFQTVKRPIQSETGETLILGSSVDVTDRWTSAQEMRSSFEAAETASRAKSEFLVTMAREIRSPMNGVIGMSGLLLGTSLTDEQRRFVQTVRDSSESLLTIVNEILDYSRIEAGQMELEQMDFDPRLLVRSVLDVFRPRAQVQHLALTEEIADDVPSLVRADSGRIRQILVKLLSNAIRFTRKGEVRVRLLGAPDGTLRFEVEDTGVGIAPDQLEYLFEVFAPGDQKRARGHSGVRLGLAISKLLCERMGGEIGVQSTPGEGSVFWFQLPTQIAEAAPPPVQLTGRSMLLVDDVSERRESFARALKELGADVICADSGAAGIRALVLHTAEGSTPSLVALLGGAVTMAVSYGPLIADTQLIVFDAVPPTLEQLIDALQATEKGEAMAMKTELVIPASSSGLRILVVEDNSVNLEVARLVLEKDNHHVDTVQGGEDAIEAVQQSVYDLILMDAQMPGMDGLTAARAIRRLSGDRGRIPIVAMTVNVMPSFQQQCAAAGMDDYITKPVDHNALLELVNSYRGVQSAATIAPMASLRMVSALKPAPAPPPAPVDPTPHDIAPFEHGAFEELVTEIGVSEVRTLMSLLESDGRDRLKRMRILMRSGARDAVRREGHALKSSAAMLGLSRASVIAKEIERGDDEDATRLIDALEKALQDGIGEVNQRLNAA
ncbi:MAG: response regulator, partial [Myxococcota bacterium]